MNTFISQSKSSILFIVVTLVVFYFLDYPTYLQKRPEGPHMWAMCDRASIARNYAEENMNLFLPRVHETREKTGITGLEFPFVNYCTAIFYKLFGFNEFWYRFLMLLIISTGFFFSFKLVNLLLKNNTVAFILPFIWYLSPVLNYYSPGFIPDVASLGFIMTAWYYFFRHQDSNKIIYGLLFFIFTALACLIKITSLISVIVMLVILLIDKYKLLNSKHIVIKHKKPIIISSVFVFILVISWYKYAAWLSSINNSGVFLMGINMPQSLDEIINVWNEIKGLWIPFYYPQIIYWLMGGSVLFLVLLFKKVNRLLGLITCGLWAGNILFIILMFNQFRQHDYYIITLLPALLFQFITTADLLLKLRIKPAYPYVILTLSVVLIVYQIKFSSNHVAYRYNKTGWLYNGNSVSGYFDIEPYIKSLGIKRTDKVINIGDDSPNIVLYYMNVKGWSDKQGNSDEEIISHIKKGASYLITNDSTQSRRKGLIPYIEKKIGQHKNVEIYLLKK